MSKFDYSKVLAKKAVDIKPSGIRKFFDIAAEMEGVISLGVGEPDFKTPWVVRDRAIENLERGRTTYSANRGLMMLREEISRYLERKIDVKYDPVDEVLVTVGGSEAIDLCIRALIEPGDEVLIVEPCFVSYLPIVELCDGVPVRIDTKAEDNFRLTAKALKEKITEKTKLLVFPFPNNPTGAVMKKEHLEEIAEVLRDTNIIVLSDEIYSELTYGTDHVSIASLPDMRERTIIVNGFSKAYSMTGWRLGYAAGPKEIMEIMTKIHQFAVMCAPTTSQHAAIEALKSCDNNIAEMREEYNIRRRFLVDGLNRLGLTCFEPEGAFYVFPCIQSTGLTSEEFCTRLLYDQKVAVVPGTAFGECGEGFVRISYSYSVEHITKALKKIGKFLEKLQNEA